jgi:hypothetical protein
MSAEGEEEVESLQALSALPATLILWGGTNPAVDAMLRTDGASSPLFLTSPLRASLRSPRISLGRDDLVPAEHLAHFRAHMPASAVIKLLPQLTHQGFALGHGPAIRQILRYARRVVAAAAAAADARALARHLATEPATPSSTAEQRADGVRDFARDARP